MMVVIYQVVPTLYAATKHAVEGYSESLDHELRTRGIRVAVIEPADTKTQFDSTCWSPTRSSMSVARLGRPWARCSKR
jgi:short-subunit dehydrogenase